MNRSSWIALSCVLAMSCRVMDTPQGFVIVKHHLQFPLLPTGDGVQFAAVAASGSRLQVQEHCNAEGGSLEFWGAAVERELSEGRGYQLLGTQPLACASGLAGRELVFRSGADPATVHYLVAVFVDGDRLLVAEAGGEPQSFAGELPAIRTALATLR
jgi:D-tyrosyl-tRNA(Tyr) deacylase